MSPTSRRALIASAAALPSIAAGAAAVPPASEAFGTAWQAYQPYRHPSLSNGLGDEGCDAWCERQLEATGRLAEAPARNLTELEAKLGAALVWFEANGATALCGEEADLLRSCLRDLRALNGGRA